MRSKEKDFIIFQSYEKCIKKSDSITIKFLDLFKQHKFYN